ncbi:hypothetical protein I4U23_016104 [Adineta vaga]|nr:hypothetical protein I4U23_016104 [Adineta vaga]
MFNMKIFLFLFIFIITEISSRSLRKRRGIWPDVLAPGGNTFAASGYYNMHSYIAYPENGIAFNSINQPWNSYLPNYYPTNQFNNNYNPYVYNNQPYPYNDQGMMNPGSGIPYGVPSNGYYPGRTGNVWMPSNNNFGGSMRPPFINARSNGNIDQPSSPQLQNKK